MGILEVLLRDSDVGGCGCMELMMLLHNLLLETLLGFGMLLLDLEKNGPVTIFERIRPAAIPFLVIPSQQLEINQVGNGLTGWQFSRHLSYP